MSAKNIRGSRRVPVTANPAGVPRPSAMQQYVPSYPQTSDDTIAAQMDVAKAGIAMTAEAARSSPQAALAAGAVTIGSQVAIPVAQAVSKNIEYTGKTATDVAAEAARGISRGTQAAANVSGSIVELLPPTIAAKTISRILQIARGDTADRARDIGKQIQDNIAKCQKTLGTLDDNIGELRLKIARYKDDDDYTKQDLMEQYNRALQMRNQQAEDCNRKVMSLKSQLDTLSNIAESEAASTARQRSQAQGSGEYALEDGYTGSREPRKAGKRRGKQGKQGKIVIRCVFCANGDCDDCGDPACPKCGKAQKKGGCEACVRGGCDHCGGAECLVHADDQPDNIEHDGGCGDVTGAADRDVTDDIIDTDNKDYDITREIVGGDDISKLQVVICLDYALTILLIIFIISLVAVCKDGNCETNKKVMYISGGLIIAAGIAKLLL